MSHINHNACYYCLQAAKDTRYKMGPAATEITIIHFNDVYNVESRDQVSCQACQKVGPRLRESCRQSQAEVASKSSNKIHHQDLGPPFS